MGTLSAMAVWGPLYATIGGASRAVLQNGGNLGEVLSGETHLLTQYLTAQSLVQFLLLSIWADLDHLYVLRPAKAHFSWCGIQ